MTEESIADILLIEDNPSDVELALHTLRRSNLANRVHVARDGAEALDFIFCRGNYEKRDIRCVPSLILLDLKLPKIDGIEILRKVKASERTQDIPVVVLTTSRNDHDILEATRLGVNDYILKPLDVNQFINSVRQIGFSWMLLSQNPEKN